jgi:hypothetical protein
MVLLCFELRLQSVGHVEQQVLERRNEQECTKMRPINKYDSSAQFICDPFESPASLKHSGNLCPSE